MIRLLKITTATLLLAVLSGMAWAECAWIMWANPYLPDTPWQPSGSYQSREACIEGLRAQARGWPKTNPGTKVTFDAEGASLVVHGPIKGKQTTISLVCLPDTLRPQ